jgi:alanine racemase
VHIEIDTGMHRLGFMPDEIDKLAVTFSSTESIRAATIFSHFAASEDPSLDSFSRKQARLFIDAAEKIRNKLGYPVLRHICNSAAIVRFPEYQFEMVRPGIGIYGAGSLDGLSLKPAGRFRTKISQVKRIPAGEPVGYGCNDTAGHERVIGIVPVGYADGLNRKLGNRNGEMLVRNRRVQIIGNICMDMCMIDISGTGAAEGDDVEIFGENIPIGELASKCQTIPYEILTSIPARVKRVFFRE